MNVDNSTSSREMADAKSLRRAFGTFATGVTVVTTGGPIPHAMTANSFTSVSLDPPLVLVCVDRGAVMHRCLTSTGFFGVSVLASHQEAAAMHFADRWRTLGAAQFEPVDWLPGRVTGVPLLDRTLASFECELWRAYDGGDHTIFIGKVLSLHQQTDLDPMLVYKGKFRQITPDWSEVTA
ncbi:flavin reductase family protein [Streptosporangium sp. NPDC000396]|uniref:flavin reductase family protein n=1 Tax=Streptosporangium sp. NPDC000396 TaxID=3366185 RepID=UPI0036C88DBB